MELIRNDLLGEFDRREAQKGGSPDRNYSSRRTVPAASGRGPTTKGKPMHKLMRRSTVIFATLAAAAVLAAEFASSASAYGGGANHDMWQVGLSFNCNNPDFCGDETGGFWGWAEFDRSADGTLTWGDAEFTFCFHTVGGGDAGAGHESVEIESWTIAPGSAGSQTFYASGEVTDSFRGTKTTEDFTNVDLGISAVPGHYSTDEVLGFEAPPGVALQVQVAFRPAK
jgi:hypothetical protein